MKKFQLKHNETLINDVWEELRILYVPLFGDRFFFNLFGDTDSKECLAEWLALNVIAHNAQSCDYENHHIVHCLSIFILLLPWLSMSSGKTVGQSGIHIFLGWMWYTMLKSPFGRQEITRESV